MTTPIAVFSGGPTDEHPISIETGKAAYRAIESLGYSPFHVVIERDLRWSVAGDQPKNLAEGLLETLARDPKGAFLALHGPFGEDGTIQAILNAAGLGYQGSDVRASALAMNKSTSKAILSQNGLPVALERVVTRANHDQLDPDDVFAALGDQVFVKPVHLGSSVGAAQARTGAELLQAVTRGLRVDEAVLIEPLLCGQELTCGVLSARDSEGEQALPSILIEAVGHDFFDFESKYTPGHNREICPAPIPAALEQELRSLAIQSHRALGCRDISRTDFIVHKGSPVILEVNTLPGLTEASLIPQAARQAGLAFEELIHALLTSALSRTLS